jgi:hypothetical protein
LEKTFESMSATLLDVSRSLLLSVGAMSLGGAVCESFQKLMRSAPDLQGISWSLGALSANAILILRDKSPLFATIANVNSAILGACDGTVGLMDLVRQAEPAIFKTRTFQRLAVASGIGAAIFGYAIARSLQGEGTVSSGPFIGYLSSLIITSLGTYLSTHIGAHPTCLVQKPHAQPVQEAAPIEQLSWTQKLDARWCS